MGDTRYSTHELQEESYRVDTYGDNNNIIDKIALAKGGFYFTRIGHKVKCADCELEVDTSKVIAQDVHTLHKEKSPNCRFASHQLVPQSRTKKFVSYDSLRFEKERLETFIDWPIDWLSPGDLAKDGFYYLRTSDHCACVFCRGIVGAWEKGDTPREEHKRHFPHCPFIKGQPVGNIPFVHSQIISRLSPSPEATPVLPLSMDVCGSGRHMPGSYPENRPPKKADLALASMGLPQHTGPKRKDFLSQESREKSFVCWPELVKQTPKELAEAGFFYCGLSDHVRCFHCGNGLRNWEKEDSPWEEHARWYPECNYVLLKKGQEFIDKVRREKPPYLRSQPAPKAGSSVLAQPTITERELDPLMELDIIKATLAMGFPVDKVRAALHRKLEQTGLPFFSLETCIEAVLQYMEEETRLALRESSARSLELEAAAQQGAKLQVLQSGTERRAAPSSLNPLTTSTTTSSFSSSSSAGPSSLLPDPVSFSSEEPMETESSISPTEDVLSQADQVIGLAEQALNAAPTSSSSPTPNTSAASSLVTSATSTPSNPSTTTVLAPPHQASLATSSTSNFSDVVMEKVAEKPLISTDKNPYIAGKPQTSQELAAELEKIKESHMCKVCMDAEIDMVFLPCTHMVTCSSCALALTHCPICRNDIKYAIKPILS